MTPIRVLVVDDSVVIRRLLTDALSKDPDIEVVGIAANGQIAQSKVAQLNPDVISMDIEMPVMGGIDAVRALRQSGCRTPIIMFSTLTERGAAATLDALAAGASDYVTKPSNVGSVQEALSQVAHELIPRIKALTPRRAPTAARPAIAAPAVPKVTLRAPSPRSSVRAVVLGSSTGGPEAISKVISGLPKPLPVPLVIVQHMPPVFTAQLAARLDRLSASAVVEAGDGVELRPGTVYIAPGDRHLALVRSASGARTRLEDTPPVNYCRPAVDVLFHSAAPVYGGDLLSVVLTGMGSDGRSGCEAIAAAGGTVLVQDEPSSVVWGMPGAVATAGLAHAILPLGEVASAIYRATLTSTGAGR